MIVFCDLDGTLCNDLHRRQFAVSRKWDIYHKLASLDKPHTDVIELLYHWAYENHTIVIITGRPESLQEQAIAWLRKYGVGFDHIHMRPADDTISPTAALKYGWIQQYDLEDQDHIVLENNPTQAKRLAKEGGLNVWNIRRGE